eukprot:Partr_v1_DN24009_c0_g1_i2_m34697 putative cardiolipin synthase
MRPLIVCRRLQSSIPSSPPPASGNKWRHRFTKNIPPAMRENIHTLPNYLTLSRIALSPFIGYFIVHHHSTLALSSFIYAGITDWLDGYLARRNNQRTALGSFLDPLADKTLMTTLTVSLSYTGAISPALGALIISRDVGLIAAASYYRFKSLPEPRTVSRYFDLSLATVEMNPTAFSKINTALQLGLMGSAIVLPVYYGGGSCDIPDDARNFMNVFQAVVGFTTVGSAVGYWMGGGSAVRYLNKKRPKIASMINRGKSRLGGHRGMKK